MASHRTVHIPYPPIPGRCRWCGKPILGQDGSVNSRRTWHDGPNRLMTPAMRARRRKGEPACLHEYLMRARSAYARPLIYRRDRGRCRDCGHPLAPPQGVPGSDYPPKPWRDWELDHHRPLKDGGSFAPANQCARCVDCHREKTSREASERAAARRALREGVAASRAAGQTSLLVALGLERGDDDLSTYPD